LAKLAPQSNLKNISRLYSAQTKYEVRNKDILLLSSYYTAVPFSVISPMANKILDPTEF